MAYDETLGNILNNIITRLKSFNDESWSSSPESRWVDWGKRLDATLTTIIPILRNITNEITEYDAKIELLKQQLTEKDTIINNQAKALANLTSQKESIQS